MRKSNKENNSTHEQKQRIGLTNKGEIIDEKDFEDFTETSDFLHENPYKTAPNYLTNKASNPNEKD